MSKRVLQIIGRSSYDGTCIYALRLAEGIAHHSFDILAGEKGKAADEINIQNVRLFHLSSAGKKKLLVFIKAVRFFIKNDYEIIHYHSGGMLLLVTAWFFRKKARLIHHIHCGNVTCNPSERKISKFSRIILKYLNSRTYKISAAEHAAEFYKKNIGGGGKIKIIKNAVPMEFCTREGLNNKIGYIGQVSSYKGFDELLNIFVHDSGRRLLVKGDNYYKKTLLHNNNNLTFIKPSLDVSGFFKEIDLLLFPSEAVYEGMPLVVLEAIANDTGVIARRTAAVCEILGNDYPLYVNTFSREEILQKICKYYSGEINREELAEHHYKLFQNHSFSEMVGEINRLYEKQ